MSVAGKVRQREVGTQKKRRKEKVREKKSKWEMKCARES